MITKARSFFKRSFSIPVLVLIVLLLNGLAPSRIFAAVGPAIDDFQIKPTDGISTSTTPFLWAHATDTVDITACQYRYMTDLDPWTGWLDTAYIPDTNSNGTPIPGSGVCMSPILSPSLGATTFSGELRVINTNGIFTDSGVSTLSINATALVVTVQPVTTDNNPLPTIQGTVDDPNAFIQVEIHSVDYSIDYFYDSTNNGDGTWSAQVTDVIAEGTYIMDVTASNNLYSSNASSQYTVSPVISDIAPPEITLNGSDPMTVEVFSNYSEPGATALDDIDGDISSNITIDYSAVDTNVIGTYLVSYYSEDTAGNSTTILRTVNVVDSQRPTISLLGGSNITIDQFSSYTDAGATASDNYDGNITANITATGSVNTSIAGDYTIKYNVSDSSGNSALEVTRIIHVVGETTDSVAPTIVSTNPTDGAKYVLYNQELKVKFSEAIDPASANESNITLKMGKTNVPFTISVDNDTILIKPIGDLRRGGTYTLHVEKIKDTSGNVLAYPYSGKFKTASYIPGKKSVDDWIKFSPLMTNYLPQTLGLEGGDKSLTITSIDDALALFNAKKNNKITSLYKELLAAKLNMAAGYSSWNISRTVRNVDWFLANNEADWSKLSKWQKDQVKDWLDTLEDFND